MVHVKLREMEKAFRSHKNLIESSIQIGSRTCKMVLFYAVECGLKALYMRKLGLRRTDQRNSFKESAFDYKHDLNRILVKLRINCKIPKVVTSGNIQIEAADLHEAWRYGKNLNTQKEEKCIESLKNILYMLKQKL
jgi:hypothetical protein